MATADFTARFVGAGRVAVQLRMAGQAAEGETREAVREAAEESVFIFRVKAPHRTGRLRRGIRATLRGDTATVTSTARSKAGFSYTAVTRFGHRVRVIRPRRAKALRFVIGGKVFFRHSVKGFRPRRDWRDAALPAVERTVEAAGSRAGARIVARVGA